MRLKNQERNFLFKGLVKIDKSSFQLRHIRKKKKKINKTFPVVISAFKEHALPCKNPKY